MDQFVVQGDTVKKVMIVDFVTPLHRLPDPASDRGPTVIRLRSSTPPRLLIVPLYPWKPLHLTTISIRLAQEAASGSASGRRGQQILSRLPPRLVQLIVENPARDELCPHLGHTTTQTLARHRLRH